MLNGEAWKASLRYRTPNFDDMLGLRRITLCENNLGDESAPVFADAIKDDLWLKGIFFCYTKRSDDRCS